MKKIIIMVSVLAAVVTALGADSSTSSPAPFRGEWLP